MDEQEEENRFYTGPSITWCTFDPTGNFLLCNMGGEQVSRDSTWLCVLARANKSLIKSRKICIWNGGLYNREMGIYFWFYFIRFLFVNNNHETDSSVRITAMLQIYLYDVKGGEKVLNLEIMSSEAEEEWVKISESKS